MPSQLRRLLELLDRVETLDLGSNPWTEPPESIVDRDPAVIINYFKDLYWGPCKVQRSSVKIILVGQEGAGKTR